MGSIKINYEGKTEYHEMEALPKQSGGGEGCEIIELTQKEYDDLPDTKLTDGKLYKIKDANINGDATTVTYVDPDGNKTNVAAELDKVSNVYSLEEKVIGIDYDGSPIYQRTFTGSLTDFVVDDKRAHSIKTLVNNVKRLVNTKGFVRNGSSELDYIDVPIDSTTIAPTLDTQRNCFCYVSRSSELCLCLQVMEQLQYCPLYVVTVEYTKL